MNLAMPAGMGKNGMPVGMNPMGGAPKNGAGPSTGSSSSDSTSPSDAISGMSTANQKKLLHTLLNKFDPTLVSVYDASEKANRMAKLQQEI